MAEYRRGLDSQLRDIGRQEVEADDMLRGAMGAKGRIVLARARLEKFVAWLEGSFTLERCADSRLHDLRAAVRKGNWEMLGAEDVKAEAAIFWPEEFKVPPQTFLVQNDWAAPLSSVTDFDLGGVRLPYDRCCFEFSISGKHVIAHLQQNDDIISVSPFMDVGDGYWILRGSCPLGEVSSSPYDIGPIISAQIRAICIALDAEVAASVQVRAPYAENRSRTKQGLPPLLDHHILSLAKRTRAAPLEYTGHGTHRSPRLHFRRGHWRHFAEHKTWIKWMLVGNPDLGFISKEYRL